MIEYRRAWQAKALSDNTLSEATNAWIEKTVLSFADQDLIARPQFIRRPERTEGITLIVARNGRLESTVVENEAALQKLDLLQAPLPEVAGMHYFVCTNAKRDVCCAKFGRPAYSALHDLIPNRVWQTTHVGGHRYAPNVLTLPDANMYGRVMASDVPRFLEDTEQNRVARAFLRGNTGYSKLAQVAEHSLVTAQAESDRAESYKLLREDQSSATFAATFNASSKSPSASDSEGSSTNSGTKSAGKKNKPGVRTVFVGPGPEAFSVQPSCGKPKEDVHPLRIKTENDLGTVDDD